MLRPYVCVACEKVILAADGVASLISLFNKIIITAPGGTEIPKNAVAPKEWAVFSAWDTDPGDELKEYTFCTQMFYPDQSQFGEVAKSRMKIEVNKRSLVTIQIIGFPIGQVGQYTVRTWVEENQQRVWGPIEFKIEVEMTKQEQPQKTT
jgi:hypothetical protein